MDRLEAEALAESLGGEEWIERFRPRHLVHTTAGIMNGDDDHALGIELSTHPIAGRRIARLQHQAATIRHRIPAVEQQIQQAALGLHRIDVNVVE